MPAFPFSSIASLFQRHGEPLGLGLVCGLVVLMGSASRPLLAQALCSNELVRVRPAEHSGRVDVYLDNLHTAEVTVTFNLISGNTGYSHSPHLHFDVFKAKDGQGRESIPILFHTREGKGIVLREGRVYRHPQ